MKQFKIFALLLSMALILPIVSTSQVVVLDMEDLEDLIMMSKGTKDTGGLGGGSSDDNSGSGGGDSGNTINLNWPEQGKMIKQDATLEWSSLKSKGPYLVTISESGNGRNIIYNSVVEGNKASIPLSNLALNVGKAYEVKVSSKNRVSEKSGPSTIMIESMSNMKEVIRTAEGHEDFADASHLRKVLMQAMALELNGYVYNASQLYKSKMESDSDYMTLRNMRDAFVRRAGM